MYKKNITQDINEYKIFALKDIIKGIIQLGPVTLRPYVDWETYLDFGASGTVDMKFGKTFSADIGYSQQEGAYIKNSTRGGAENRIIKSIMLDGNASIGIRNVFDVGCGLYTKNIALELNPYLDISLSTDLRLTGNDMGWRQEAKVNFDANIGADGRLVVNWFGNLKLTPTLKFFQITLFHKDWPLLPKVDESSFSVNRDKSVTNALVFAGEYDITGGLLSLFGAIHPGIAVYKGGDLVYKKTTNPATSYNTKQRASFNLDGLQEDISYTAKPVITVFGISQELDGIPFSSTSPTAAITDIVQTSSAEGTFYHNGNEYKYMFEFYINAYLIGSENCLEWGTYAPQSDKVYNPIELKDGKVTTYWTGWSNSSTATFSETPYVKLLDGSIKLFVTHTHTCYYGGSSQIKAHPLFPQNSEIGDMVIRLDSVIVEE